MRNLPQAALGIVLALGLVVAPRCEGGPVLDWLFHRPDGTAYTAYSAPGTTPLPGVAPDGRHVVGYAPGSPYGIAPTGYAAPPLGYAATSSAYRAGYAGTNGPAPTGGSCGPGVCYETVLRYLPETSYRTQWAPVPVTQYTTSTSTNPATGLPITCTRPCTTYTWQARREPYTSFRPIYQQVPLSGDPAFAQPLAGYANGVGVDGATAAPVRAFRPFGGLFTRDRSNSTYAPNVVATPPASGLAWGGMLPPATAGGNLPIAASPTPNTYAYTPPTSGCASCGGASSSSAPVSAPPYGTPYSDGSASSFPSQAVPQSDGTVATPWQRLPSGSDGQVPSEQPPYEPASSDSNRGTMNDADTVKPRIDSRELRQRAGVDPPSGTSKDDSTDVESSEFKPNDFPANDFPANNNRLPDFPANNGSSSGGSSSGTKSPTSLRALRDLHHEKPAPVNPSADDAIPSLLNESKDRTASWSAPQGREPAQFVPIARTTDSQPERRDYRRNVRNADTRAARPSSDGGWRAP